jgi:hypothetical protein
MAALAALSGFKKAQQLVWSQIQRIHSDRINGGRGYYSHYFCYCRADVD